MTKLQRAARIAEVLNRHYPVPPIPQEHRDTYTLLIAVLLSAQCTDVRVNQVTPALFKLAATPEEMMHVPVEEIRTVIRPCGLSPRKSAAIIAHGLLSIEFPEVARRSPFEGSPTSRTCRSGLRGDGRGDG